MTPFTFYEVLAAIGFSAAFGLAIGSLYDSCGLLIFAIKQVFLVEFFAISSNNPKAHMASFKKKTELAKHRNTPIYDFVFFFSSALILFVLQYVTLDGVFRWYLILFSAVGFFVAKRTLGAFSSMLLTKILYHIYRLLFMFLFYIQKPIKYAVAFVYRPISKLYISLNSKRLKRRAENIIAKKQKTLRAFILQKDKF